MLAATLLAPTSYSTVLESKAVSDTSPPTGLSGLQTQPLAGGVDVGWGPATDNNRVAGYVVRWRLAGTPTYASRTLFGPILSCEIKGLEPVSNYEIQAFAYDATGNIGPAAVVSATTGQ